MRIGLLIIVFLASFNRLWSTESEPSRSALMYEECMRHFTNWNKELVMASTDSLLQVALEEKDSFYIAKAYDILGEMAYMGKEYEKSEEYNRLNIPILTSIESYEPLIMAYLRLKNISRKLGKEDSLLPYLNSARNYISKVPEDSKIVDQIYNELAINFLFTGQVDSAIFYGLKRFDLKVNKDSLTKTKICHDMSSVFASIRNDEKFVEYLDLAFDYCPANHVDLRTKLMTLKAIHLFRSGEVKKGESLVRAAILKQESTGKKEHIVYSHVILSKILRSQNRFKECKSVLNKVSYIEQSLNVELSSRYYIERLAVALDLEDEDIIEKYIVDVLKIINSLKSIEQKYFLDKLLADYYQRERNYRLSNEYMQRYIEGRDSILKMESKQIALNLESKFKNEKNQLVITSLQQKEVLAQKDLSRQKGMIWGGGIVLGLITLISFFLYSLYKNNQRQKNRISKTLSEKDTLLREIHHRVKNNLQLVSSLLTLQSRSIKDETAIAAINDGKARVRSMALIHQDLYNKDSLTGITVKNYIEKLCGEIFNTYKVSAKEIELKLDIEDLELDVETVVPLGLIINELLTNALKYAFNDQSSGEVVIHLKQKGSGLLFKMTDNGIGMNIKDFDQSTSFGNRLVKILTEQIEGDLKITNEQGTEMEIFIKAYKKVA